MNFLLKSARRFFFGLCYVTGFMGVLVTTIAGFVLFMALLLMMLGSLVSVIGLIPEIPKEIKDYWYYYLIGGIVDFALFSMFLKLEDFGEFKR